MDINEKIKGVFVETIRMFDLTIQYLEEALAYFKESSNGFIKMGEIDDDNIDRSLISIEKTCLNIILRERPFATNLREITGIFKLVDDIERLGDHSEDLVWCVNNLKNAKANLTQTKALKEMVDVSIGMVKDAYDSLVKDDVKLAVNVLNTDDVVDDLYIKVLNELSLLKYQNSSNEYFIYITLIAKYLERIADHASNIAEWVIYIKSGYYKDEVII